MISGISSSDERFLSAVSNINKRMQTAEAQLSSGRLLNTASDAPDSISAVLAARASLSQTTQIGLNLSRAQIGSRYRRGDARIGGLAARPPAFAGSPGGDGDDEPERAQDDLRSKSRLLSSSW